MSVTIHKNDSDKAIREAIRKVMNQKERKSGPHKFYRPMQQEAFDWFDRWLKG